MKTRLRRSMVLASSGALLLGMAAHAWAVPPAANTACVKGQFPASGQTTAYTADTSTTSGADVPDDGTVQAGATLRYKDNGNGTITDQNTGLIWEMKVAGSGCLHCVGDAYPWSLYGSTTIWDWLEAVNAEGGKGLAGHHDWRIPNVKELQSIVDYVPFGPSIDPGFGDTAASPYWSSSTFAFNPADAWVVGFGLGPGGGVFNGGKSNGFFVRAVRGGCL